MHMTLNNSKLICFKIKTKKVIRVISSTLEIKMDMNPLKFQKANSKFNKTTLLLKPAQKSDKEERDKKNKQFNQTKMKISNNKLNHQPMKKCQHFKKRAA